jgi:16S rRNA C967 or C1407 C5-methylase (RsmB/RsmF family)
VEALSARHAGWHAVATRRFSPASTDTDGFFAALLQGPVG